MARVTVEDCVQQVPNRFDLVMLASQRSRNISAGAPLTVDADNDKNHVIALREIADKTVDLKDLEEQLIQGMQRHVETDEPEEDELDMQSIQQELLGEGDPPAETAADDDSLDESDDDSETSMDAAEDEGASVPLYQDEENIEDDADDSDGSESEKE